MPDHIKELAFEKDIEEWLLTEGGYRKGDPAQLDAATGIDIAETIEFIKTTQADKWAMLLRRSSSETGAVEAFTKRLVAALDDRGTLDVLKTNIDVTGVTFKVAILPPPSERNESIAAKSRQNRLSVYRQVRFEPGSNETLDLLIAVNGVPTCTAELKNPLNGQTLTDAITQYQDDRDYPRNVILNKRCLVHFAVDTNLVAMTTKLDGPDTSFLPFNRGSNPGELSCGKGNPVTPGDFATSYLWEQVWAYDGWLDVIQNFFAVTSETEGGVTRTKTIFPRYQQWDAVRHALQAVTHDGPGKSYLFQHSAGSGKSNTIAWLGDRLSRLHRADDDERMFAKVIVITDRRVLDEQLRKNVEQFERAPGSVQTVVEGKGSKSSQLLDALRSNAKIVTVTLESFPYVIGKLAGDEEFKSKSYAVIADEAHSSQTGEANRALKEILGAGVDVEGDDDEKFGADDAIAAILASRGKQPNLSFFAFTATPKPRTVAMFGTEVLPGEPLRPFHLYTMRQAIEEKFILDVLKNYVTYETYYKVASADPSLDDEEVPTSKVNSAIRRVVHANPAMITEKAAIIVEHVRANTMRQLDGRAQAMVVTESRAAAVRYKQAIDAHIDRNGYGHMKSLVAFSGTIADDHGVDQTEAGMNGISDKQTAAAFIGKDPHKPGVYQILVVAEKYQTGFDDPLLNTMFVDKKLSGLSAVQTLSRLNRSYSNADVTKENVYVIDFRNTAEEIAVAFQPFFEGTTTEPIEIDRLWDLKRELDDTGLLDPDEIRTASDVWFGARPEDRQLKKIQSILDAFVVRYVAADVEIQTAFRDTGDSFVRAYSFISHLLTFTDEALERLYVFTKAALKVIPSEVDGAIEIGDRVTLTHLRLTSNNAFDIELVEGLIAPGQAFPGDGVGGGVAGDPPSDVFAAIIEEVNARYGADLDDRDKLEAEKLDLGARQDPDLKALAKDNGFDDFLLEYERIFKGVMLDQQEKNGRLYDLLFTNSETLKVWEERLARRFWEEVQGD